MSVFDGDMDFITTYNYYYTTKEIALRPYYTPVPDPCMLVGLSRDTLAPRPNPPKTYDVLCPIEMEHYKDYIPRFKEDNPCMAKRVLKEELDVKPIEDNIQDLKRTEYLVKYCPRELPFMSANMARRAKAMKSVTLPDDVFIPATTQRSSYRKPPDEKYKEHPLAMSMKPKVDDSLCRELRKILRVKTEASQYTYGHGVLAQVILDKNPYGPSREEPKYGRWRDPCDYTYRV